ncbi:unnamed protein product, partial [Symbiodinium sp. KB8]
MATGSSSDRATEEDTLVDAAVEPHEPPYGPPPPQNLFSLRLSQALVDAMAPNIQHQGAFLTKIQGRIIDCVGITAVLRPMTPNEFLERDVLHFSESPPPSELEDPEDTAPESMDNDGGRARARRASAEWLERRGEIESMMAAAPEGAEEDEIEVDGDPWSGSSQHHFEYRAWARGGLTANIYQDVCYTFDCLEAETGQFGSSKSTASDIFPGGSMARRQQFSIKGVMTAWKRDDLLEQANAAAWKGNLFGLWKVVKQLAPK